MYVRQLSAFFKAIADDPRIAPTHISLYMALVQQWNVMHFENPVRVKRKDIMQGAKIAARVTFYKCMRDLHDFGYIRYSPAGHRYMDSCVYLKDF